MSVINLMIQTCSRHIHRRLQVVQLSIHNRTEQKLQFVPQTLQDPGLRRCLSQIVYGLKQMHVGIEQLGRTGSVLDPEIDPVVPQPVPSGRIGVTALRILHVSVQ